MNNKKSLDNNIMNIELNSNIEKIYDEYVTDIWEMLEPAVIYLRKYRDPHMKFLITIDGIKAVINIYECYNPNIG
ncbi:MAG: hypothetical protein FWC41_00135 [Firmicutes bacterium]|nr:hypothetical protein [Bacillota bacterium]